MVNAYTHQELFEFEGALYVILESALNDYFIVAKKEDVDKGVFPVPVYIIPHG
jgi:hypothetical protein